VAAARVAVLSYAGAFLLLGVVGHSGREFPLRDAVMPVLGPVGQVYLYLLVVCSAIRWGLWGCGTMAALRYVVWTVVEVVKGVGCFWGRAFMRYWKVVFAVGMCWVVVSVVKEVDFGEAWLETAGPVLLQCAERIYALGDVVRDIAGSMKLC
jgi:hypothetical protein